MTGAGLDPDQLRRIAGIGGLQRGGVLEGVARHDAVVGVSRGHQYRGVVGTGSDVVVGRVRKQCLELIRVGRGAVVVDPEAAGGELVETQHVHHAHRRQRGGEKIRALVGHGAD